MDMNDPAELDRLYYYEGTNLGARYTKEKTTFRLWAPTAMEAKIVLYSEWNQEEGKEIEMKRSEKGTWAAELSGNQDGLIYTYKVKINDKWNEAVDPYAKAVTVNGDKGVVVNLKDTDPDRWTFDKPELNDPLDTIIYEVHVRDLSIFPDSGITHKGKFIGAIEQGTTGPGNVKTGIDHIKDLGVTHVQFLPIFDFATVDETKLNEPQYNWGYDPKNFNAPEGSYSTDPYNPKTRIKELKEMIQAYHDHGLRVIMDVVYNHVHSVEDSPFHKLVPNYYFRYNEDGNLSNGTGVGNDMASEHKMVRKYIVDSIMFWATEYHLDGFRFDLMGILDVETMNEVRKTVNKINPSIIILGEGWDMGTPLSAEQKANQKNAQKMPGIAHFNDSIRDGLKGFVMEAEDKGFVNGKPGMEDIIKKGIAGGLNYDDEIATYQYPDQVINYVEAHDNYTLWDKLQITNSGEGTDKIKKMHKLASSIVLFSQGIPLIHAGQEFMRTKDGDENSYQSSDWINRLDWDRRSLFNNEVNYMKGLIALRKNEALFHLKSEEEINNHLTFREAPANAIVYTLEKNDEVLFIVHNANHHDIDVKLPDNGPWSLLVNDAVAGTEEIERIQKEDLSITALSTFVLKKCK